MKILETEKRSCHQRHDSCHPGAKILHAEIVEVEIEVLLPSIVRPFGEFRRAKSHCHLYGAQGQRQAYLLPMPRCFVGLDLTTSDRTSETPRNVSPSEQEDEREQMPTSAIKDLLKKWADVRAMVIKWHPNQVDVSRVGDLYNDNAINYFWKILKKREKQSTWDMFFNAP
ncbi:uncharacterized protein TNCV_3772871 [Trichonephila clavipes]|nr:uncharacterized protein TNCV_3772871 [Trichonephila clavipes]